MNLDLTGSGTHIHGVRFLSRAAQGKSDRNLLKGISKAGFTQGNKMKIYLASRFANHEKLNILAANLAIEGHTVMSSWHSTEALSPVPKDDPDYPANCVRAAERDLREIAESDALILFTENCEAVPGGLWFEAGYAKALGKACFIKGPRMNAFCYLCSDWPD